MTGQFAVSTDTKGRIVLPVPLRDGLGAPFVITRAPEAALICLPLSTWKRLELKRGRLTLFRGYFQAAAHVIPHLHGPGRFVVPQALREHADLRPGVEVTLAGMQTFVHVTRADRARQMARSRDYGALSQLILDLEL